MKSLSWIGLIVVGTLNLPASAAVTLDRSDDAWSWRMRSCGSSCGGSGTFNPRS